MPADPPRDETSTRGLAYRRHQWGRAKARAARLLRSVWGWDAAHATARQVARYALDRRPCSCPMCGNPRKWLGEPTRQEMRAERDPLA